jgi:3-hydroxyisobutyrate dehydrogenase
MSEKIGFVGLGNMGRPMSRRLVEAGFAVQGYDLDRARLADVAGTNRLTAATGLKELAQNSDIVITMLPNGHIVREVVLAPDGLAAGLKSGGVIVDMSSAGATGTAELGAELKKRGIVLIDAPVSGGVTGADAGTLSIMIGGDDEAAIARVQPILAAMGKNLFRCGKLGAGHATKSINNYLGALACAATAEGLVMGTRFGIDPQTLLDVINASTGVNGASQRLFPGQVMNRKFGAGFALALMAKDVGLAAELGRSLGMDAPYASLSEKLWAQARDAMPNADFTEMAKWIEQNNGVELKGRQP